MSINIPAFISSLGIMVEGWLGIFIVMIIIMLVILVLNFVTKPRKKAQ